MPTGPVRLVAAPQAPPSLPTGSRAVAAPVAPAPRSPVDRPAPRLPADAVPPAPPAPRLPADAVLPAPPAPRLPADAVLPAPPAPGVPTDAFPAEPHAAPPPAHVAAGPFPAALVPAAPFPAAPPSPLSPTPVPARDSVTRYLCAAAHLDAGFGDAAIAEYLVERTRALPPSLGVDTVAVLREAVAARARRRMRDGVLLAALLLLTVVGLPFVLFWTLAAAVVEGIGRWSGSRMRLAAAVLAALLGASLLLTYGVGAGTIVAYLLYSVGVPADVLTGSLLVVLLPALAIAVVLTVDEFAVTELTRQHFRPRTFVADALSLPPGKQRSLRTWGLARYTDAIARVQAQEAHTRSRGATADVIVHRGRGPFVGAGVMVRDETLALPLVPDEDAGEEPVPFCPSDLHEHVSAALAELRDSASLSPGGRLGALSIIEQVFLPAEQMLRESGTTMRPMVLPDASRPPVDHLAVETARRLADEPQEAARYYRCYRVESWDRDLATSSYFTAGTDRQRLYIEWTHSVLLPIRDRYRSIDRHADSGPARRAFEAVVTFPVTVPHRVTGLFRRFSPIPHGVDEIEPGRYGAGPNLRELASAPEPDTFFQEADALRYTTIVEQAFFTAVGTFLAGRHYSIVDVLDAAKAKISNSLVIANGTFVNSAVGIGDVRTTNGAATPRAVEEKK